MSPKHLGVAAYIVLFGSSALPGQELAHWPVGTRLYFEGKIVVTTQKDDPALAPSHSARVEAQLLVLSDDGQGLKRFLWAFSPEAQGNFRYAQVAPLVVRLKRARGEARFTVEVDDEAPDPRAFDLAQEWQPPFPTFAEWKAPGAGEFADSTPQNFGLFVAKLPRKLDVTLVEKAGEPSLTKIAARSGRKLPWRSRKPGAGTAESPGAGAGDNSVPRLTSYAEDWTLDQLAGRLVAYSKLYAVEQQDPPLERSLRYELREVSRELLDTTRLAEVAEGLIQIGRAEARLRLGTESLEAKQKTIATLRPGLKELGLESHAAFLEDEVRRQQVQRAEENKNLELIGKEAPDFTLKNLGGIDVALSSYRGKPILLVFWGVG